MSVVNVYGAVVLKMQTSKPGNKVIFISRKNFVNMNFQLLHGKRLN